MKTIAKYLAIWHCTWFIFWSSVIDKQAGILFKNMIDAMNETIAKSKNQ